MKKPSERILEIRDELIEKEDYQVIPASIISIKKYLDEEYEKNQPCIHEKGEPIVGGYVCKKCHTIVVFE